jgi:hypothetical protein
MAEFLEAGEPAFHRLGYIGHLRKIFELDTVHWLMHAERALNRQLLCPVIFQPCRRPAKLVVMVESLVQLFVALQLVGGADKGWAVTFGEQHVMMLGAAAKKGAAITGFADRVEAKNIRGEAGGAGQVGHLHGNITHAAITERRWVHVDTPNKVKG